MPAHAPDPVLICPANEKADREVLNQRAVVEYLAYFVDTGRQRITEGDILEIHRLTIEGIYPCAGRYRDATKEITIVGSRHKPADAFAIKNAIADMLTWHYGEGQSASEFYRAARILWQINAIHPFAGGNGRVARAVCYLVVVTEIAPLFAGEPLPAKLKTRKARYLEGLQVADRGDMRLLTSLITECVTEQFREALLDLTHGLDKEELSPSATRLGQWVGRKLGELVRRFTKS